MSTKKNFHSPPLFQRVLENPASLCLLSSFLQYLSIYLSIYLSSIYLSVYLPIYLYVYSGRILQKQDGHNTYAVTKIICPPGCYLNGFAATQVLGHMMYIVLLSRYVYV